MPLGMIFRTLGANPSFGGLKEHCFRFPGSIRENSRFQFACGEIGAGLRGRRFAAASLNGEATVGPPFEIGGRPAQGGVNVSVRRKGA